MISWIAPLQPLLLGLVLLWSARLKLLSPHAAAAAGRSALARLVGDERALPTYRLVGVVEAALGLVLLAPPTLPAEALAAAALSLGFTGYLVYARLAAPESSCGCLSATRTPVRWRSFARTGGLLAASLLALPATVGWFDVLRTRPLPAVALLLAEAALLVALSPELDRHWLDPLRQLKVQVTRPLPAGGFDVPLDSTVEQLHRSPVWRETAVLLTSDLREHWDDDGWRILVFTARHFGQEVSAVYAVPRLRYRPAAVRVVLIDEPTGRVVLSLESPPDSPEPDWVRPSPSPAAAAA
ncbi:MauE/DoxX family redox-associated membrane protein [Catellatospora sichuanensis]|uniref:MauE/DoxX family redox-associated membrane protein n=1 Tax=Catellatospora sichuanensis TaxID=1969805 RepID=UPI00164260E0|nr:MauE/DoxX family redox-associated membrane protein [Catellatospora sichuanensis]